MADYIQVTINEQDSATTGLLVAMLSETGYEGFEETGTGLKAFIPAVVFNEKELKDLLSRHQCSYTLETIAEQNWNAQWESGFEPVQVGNFAIIRAGFHQPVPGVAYDIVITPKMSFGTGHHATTYMMVEQMAAIDFKGKSVLDFGTGTGILAILAEKMGAATILAIDNDDWSVNNSLENIAANGCVSVSIEKAEAIPEKLQFDVILANINLNVITASLPAIAMACKPGSKILLSGFLAGDEAVLQPMLEQQNFREIAIFCNNNWRCIAATLS
jgi:ribosomal protein L11 methyltransferase